MKNVKRARDYHIHIGNLPTGPLNKISDVKGVTVGHTTVRQGDVHTGVTAILPHQGNLFKDKVVAASHVLNGFGKTIGTVQINELGTLETPILLTNTLSVGICATHLINYMLRDNPEIGRSTGTINPVVGECNDMHINDIRQIVLTEDHVFSAIEGASEDFREGAIGAGMGMRSFGLKGGIGSASRQFAIGKNTYTLGVLVLSNYGSLPDLTIKGRNVGRKIAELQRDQEEADKGNDSSVSDTKDRGSIIMIAATDLPVTERQLQRIIKRCGVGLSRTGSNMGHGSGDIVIGFSTATHIAHEPTDKILNHSSVHEEELDLPFQAIAEATEEAILNSMLTAETTVGRSGNKLQSLSEYLEEI
ncbi:MAG: P1 family peptidase [Bacillus sp. (in: Bacteria)]|nr:P1 family peptidase [Bacillus sp. (in: firmicutes)]